MLMIFIPLSVTKGSRHSSSCMALLCTPKDLGTDGPVMSASKTPTLSPAFAQAEASMHATRLFPTPPLPLTMPITFLMFEYLFIGFCRLCGFLSPQFCEQVEQSCVHSLILKIPLAVFAAYHKCGAAQAWRVTVLYVLPFSYAA